MKRPYSLAIYGLYVVLLLFFWFWGIARGADKDEGSIEIYDRDYRNLVNIRVETQIDYLRSYAAIVEETDDGSDDAAIRRGETMDQLKRKMDADAQWFRHELGQLEAKLARQPIRSRGPRRLTAERATPDGPRRRLERQGHEAVGEARRGILR